ncbi:MAG TPA: hypothetical protein VGR25_13230 [bacterium]|nr:hypothetical protein [bacterium]
MISMADAHFLLSSKGMVGGAGTLRWTPLEHEAFSNSKSALPPETQLALVRFIRVVDDLEILMANRLAVRG